MKMLIIVLMVAGLSACRSQSNPQMYKGVLSLETYKVPAGLESEVQSALKGLLNVKEREGKVRSLPGGYILVAASPNFQAGIRKLIRQLKSQPPVNEANVRLSVWYVAGKTGDKLHVPKELKPVRGTLQALFDSQGFADFRLVEELQNIAKNGEFVTTKGTFLETKNTSRIYNGRSNLIIDAKTPFDKIKSNFFIKPNQTLVLGRVGFTRKTGAKLDALRSRLGDFVKGKNSERDISFFYLVKAEVVD